jgi:trehalose 2-sulfotransferase
MTIVSFLSQTGVHEKSLRHFFNGNVEYTGPAIIDHPLYCIGFFNRSGSNLLAGYLRATPFFSGFHEQLNFDTVQKQSAEWGVTSFPDFIKEATARFAKGKFAHGFKASVDQLMMLQRFGIPNMYAGGLRIIHITRQDLIGQAISYQIASQTQKWTSKQAGIGEDVTVRFDAQQVTRLVDGAQASANGIAIFAEIFGHPRLPVSYEDLVQSPHRILHQIAGFAGREGEDWPVEVPEIERQVSALNAQFRQLFLTQAQQEIL